MGDIFGKKKTVDGSTHIDGVEEIIFEIDNVDQQVDRKEDKSRGKNKDNDPEENIESINVRHD